VKIVHAIIQVAVLIFASIALKAVFDSHNKASKPIPNMYSIHSWIGLTAVILFGMQWVCGFVSYLFPKLSDALRSAYMPHHRFWGVAIFVLCCTAALMGITEKAFFSLPKYLLLFFFSESNLQNLYKNELDLNQSGQYSQLPGEGVLINLFGFTIMIYGILVVYLVSREEYKRPPEHVN
jgi:cytochrome b-561